MIISFKIIGYFTAQVSECIDLYKKQKIILAPNYTNNFNASPINAATNIICGSFAFFILNGTMIVNKAIKAVGMSLIVLIAITITEPAKAPTVTFSLILFSQSYS